MRKTIEIAKMSTVDLVEKLNAIRAELGEAWEPGWRGVTDGDAEEIIDELTSRGTGMALDALADHGLDES